MIWELFIGMILIIGFASLFAYMRFDKVGKSFGMGGHRFRDYEIRLFCFQDSVIFFFSFQHSEINSPSETEIFPF